jgi:uncharacterized protein YukE
MAGDQRYNIGGMGSGASALATDATQLSDVWNKVNSDINALSGSWVDASFQKLQETVHAASPTVQKVIELLNQASKATSNQQNLAEQLNTTVR